MEKVVRSPTGPSRCSLSVNRPTVRLPRSRLAFPSAVRTSMTPDARPPNRAGKALLYRETSRTDSGMKTETTPSMWSAPYRGIPSRRIRFSSAYPPRTLIPEKPSCTGCTPGRSCKDFSTSRSPKRTGIFHTVRAGRSSRPGCVSERRGWRESTILAESRTTGVTGAVPAASFRGTALRITDFPRTLHSIPLPRKRRSRLVSSFRPSSGLPP